MVRTITVVLGHAAGTDSTTTCNTISTATSTTTTGTRSRLEPHLRPVERALGRRVAAPLDGQVPPALGARCRGLTPVGRGTGFKK